MIRPGQAGGVLLGLGLLGVLPFAGLPPFPGFVTTGGPFVLWRALFGSATVIDHVPLAFAWLESAAWLAGVVVLLRSRMAGARLVSLAWLLSYHGASTLLMMSSMYLLMWGVPIAFVASGLVHGLLGRREDPHPVQVVIEAAFGGFPVVIGFGASTWFVMQFWPGAGAVLALGLSVVLVSVSVAVRRPHWRPWVLSPVLLLAPLSSAAGNFANDSVFFVDDLQIGARAPEYCAGVRGASEPGIRWLDSEVRNPYGLFILPPKAKDERLLAIGERSARLIQVRPDGGVAKVENLGWGDRCDTPEAVAIDEKAGVGWVACSGEEYIRFNLVDPGKASFIEWPPEHQEPLDVRVLADTGQLLLTYSYPAVIDRVRFDGTGFVERKLYNYRGLVGSLPRFEDAGGRGTPRLLVSGTGLLALDPDTLAPTVLNHWEGAFTTSVVPVGDAVALAALRSSEVIVVEDEGRGSVRRIPVPGGPRYLVASPRRLWASPYFGDSIVALERDTWEPVEHRLVGSRPRSLRWSAEHGRLYGVSLCGVFSSEEGP